MEAPYPEVLIRIMLWAGAEQNSTTSCKVRLVRPVRHPPSMMAMMPMVVRVVLVVLAVMVVMLAPASTAVRPSSDPNATGRSSFSPR